MIVKTDDPKYLKDTYSNAIIRNDKKTLDNHRNKVKQNNLLMNHSNEINNLKSEIFELKCMLRKILEKISQD